MITFILRKLGILVPTFLGVTLIAFVFIRLLPGDPVLLMAGERGMTEERHARLMKEFGFDRPILVDPYDENGEPVFKTVREISGVDPD